MPPSAHHLRRLRLQARAADQATGLALRSLLETGLSRRLAAVVAAVCDELGPEEELLQLDRIELRLGAFPLEALEREAPLALERALREALLQALAAARHNPPPGCRLLSPPAARLERFVTYLRLGALPWRVASEPFSPADDLLALLQDESAALLAAVRGLVGERSAMERLLLQLDSQGFAQLLAALAPADANKILACLAELLAHHQQGSLLPDGPDRLRRSLWLVSLTLLLRNPGTPFNRPTFLDQLLRGLAAEQGTSYSLLLRQLDDALPLHPRGQPLGSSLPALIAELRGLRRSLAPAPSQPPPAFAVDRWEAFLRTGQPAHLGHQLQEAVEHSPARFVALLRALLASLPATPPMGSDGPPPVLASGLTRPILLGRLLRWLTPDALAMLAAAAEPRLPALELARGAEWLADAPSADLASAWSQLLLQRLADRGAPPSAPPTLAAAHLDRLGLGRAWLGLEVPPPWLPAQAAEPPGWVIAPPWRASELDLRRLLQLPAADSDALLLALMRLQNLARAAPAGAAADDRNAADFERVLEMLLPDLRQPAGPLAAALAAAAAPAARDAVRLRAVALALAGSPPTLEELRRPLPPLLPPWPAEAAPGGGNAPTLTDVNASPDSNDRQRLLSWLSGEGPEVPPQLPTLLRLFVSLADQRDASLLACLRQDAGRAEPRRRWSRQLPEALLGRVVLLLQPGRGRLLLDLQALLSLAWRQAALPGDPAPARELPWETLLPLLVTPQPLATRWISVRLLEAICGTGDRRHPSAERLLRRARQLASAALPLLAALEVPPISPPSASPRSGSRPEWPAHAATSPVSAVPPPSQLEELAAGLYIANAGLVLLNPFLPRLFDRLGLLSPASDGGFPAIRGLEDRSKAVHLLQWLVDERLDAPEPDLALNKVLAGIELADPILPSQPASEDELAIATELLQAVIQHWPPLANTSLAGLRETFLQREGRLQPPTLDKNQWSLLVQRRTVDVLMERLPWPVTLVRHRWMAAPLHVNW